MTTTENAPLKTLTASVSRTLSDDELFVIDLKRGGRRVGSIATLSTREVELRFKGETRVFERTPDIAAHLLDLGFQIDARGVR